MKVSELKKAMDEALKDLPEGADPDILVVDESRFSNDLKKVSVESWHMYADRLLNKKIRTDYIMYLEVE